MHAASLVSSESESELIARAQTAVSNCNWEVGACAAQWTRKFARGRTDNDFAQLVGLSADQVYQRRRVWETFADVHGQYPALKWSHFYSALTWDDAAECLHWAQDVGATVAEMRAWRRAQRGEDLTTEAVEDDANWLLTNPMEVRVPGGDASTSGDRAPGISNTAEAVPVAAGFAREVSGGDDYAPFQPNAITPPSREEAPERAEPTVEAIVRRLTTTLERCAALMTDDFAHQFETVKDKDRRRFLKAIEAVAEKAADLR